MKKLFSFRSSSSNCNGNTGCPLSAEKQIYWEMPSESGLSNRSGNKADSNLRSSRGLFSKSRKQISDNQSSSVIPGLRRSRSMSSTAFFSDTPEQKKFLWADDQNGSPSSCSNGASRQQYSVHSSRQVLTPENQAKVKRTEVTVIQDPCVLERLGSSASSKSHHDSLANSSSSNGSGKVLDRYIDGEQLCEERSKPKSNSSHRQFAGNGNAVGRLPPRVQYTAPSSPTDSAKDKTRSYSFRDAKTTRFPSRGLVDNGFGHESPRSIAKNVVEKLSQSHAVPRSSPNEFDHDIPITIEDIYSGSMNRCFNSKVDEPAQKIFSLDELYETINDYHGEEDFSNCGKQDSFCHENVGDVNSVQSKDALDLELQQRSKVAEERVVFLSEALDQESFLHDSGFDVMSLLQTIRTLKADKLGLAIEVSGLFKAWIAERDSAMEELRLGKAELESHTRRLEKEKSELQSALEKELDRRSSDWSKKLEKYQLEEQRLRERVRELAEQNVSLQREVSLLNQRETESKNVIVYSEQQIKHLTSRMEEVSGENQDLKQKLSEFQEKYTAVQDDLYCVKRNFEQKDNECKEMQKSITRLLRNCSDQEKTIVGLRQVFSEEFETKQSLNKFDKQVAKIQMEQMRLTGLEMTLRREVESYRLEVDSLRNENINLLNRLKDNGKEIDALTFKLDKEVQTRVSYLQNQGLGMLNESAQLCSKLLEYVKGKTGQFSESKQGTEFAVNGLDGQFLVESDMKIQGFKRRTESFTRSLQTISSLLQEKSNMVALRPQTPWTSESKKLDDQTADNVRVELKAESLLTTLLREKLYSKESEVEQLHAEMAAAIRGNDMLRSEVQNALDNLSLVNHKFKELELEVLKKDDNISQLQRDLLECKKELTIVKGILPKVSEERDLMWEEVKQYNEKNMLLNSEVNILKKKIEALDEDILLKEGQITILKDTLGSRPFDLLASPGSIQEFLLK
ncbi:hypothetical protein K2173_020423 [Erythroxylum novogranatense]|uniref:DUF7653 domain-containing protein n=1 Tax=Erythroxylum novogranatense TaxID=1862640 RepID=A0AAV8TGB3_9ROSI|nr:hypothetical protein K2173_020423 [Erythroxylum novogranatense]